MEKMASSFAHGVFFQSKDCTSEKKDLSSKICSMRP